MAKKIEVTWKIPLSELDMTKEMKFSVSASSPQHVTSTVGKPDGKIISGVIDALPLGTGASLKGKTIRCNSLVTDFDSNSNNIEVTFEVNQYAGTYKETVAADGDAIVYKVKIQFV